MDTLLLCLGEDRVTATRFPGTPETLKFHGKRFKASGSLGDFNYLRSQRGDLVGFVIDISEREIRLLASILSRARNVLLTKRQIFFLLSDEGNYEIECVQASSWLYRGPKGEQLIGVHEWKSFGNLGFKVDDDNAIR